MRHAELMMRLRDKAQDLRKQGYSMKTKAAGRKRFERSRRVERAAHTVLNRVLPEGTKLVLTSEMLCSLVFGGGGCGIPKGATIEVLNSSIAHFTFSFNGEVFQADLFSGGWTRHSLDALVNAEVAA